MLSVSLNARWTIGLFQFFPLWRYLTDFQLLDQEFCNCKYRLSRHCQKAYLYCSFDLPDSYK